MLEESVCPWLTEINPTFFKEVKTDLLPITSLLNKTTKCCGVCVGEHCVLCALLQLLNAIQLFGANLDDYLHLLLPPIVKLFDAPDVPLQARKSVPCVHGLC